MYVPEYTITKEILNNIAVAEYGKSIVENTTILPNWEGQLRREALIKTIKFLLDQENLNIPVEKVKKQLDGIAQDTAQSISNTQSAYEYVLELSKEKEFEEESLKMLHQKLTNKVVHESKSGKYRSVRKTGGTDPQEILAKMVELLDWYYSMDAKDTHPILIAGIMRARILEIQPFENFNNAMAGLISLLCVKSCGYIMRDFLSFEEYFVNSRNEHFNTFASISKNEGDVTDWLEYFTEGVANEISKLQEQVLLLARDTKIAKVTGRAELSKRQERIIEFLQDYGLIRNSDFPRVFPDISEDSVLRDLKVLVEDGIVVKKGKTKSSRYELK